MNEHIFTIEEIKNFENREEFEEIDYIEEIKIDDGLLLLTNLILISERHNLMIRTGEWCELNDDGEYEPDWSFTLIHRSDETPDKYLYIEQGGISSTLRNFASSFDMTTELLKEKFAVAA